MSGASAQSNFVWWDEDRRLLLITKEILGQLPHGTILYSIDGRRVTVGQDEIDTDSRYGMLAYGFLMVDAEESQFVREALVDHNSVEHTGD